MDIAKIRKKAREQGTEKKQAEVRTADAAGVDAPGESEVRTEDQEQASPEGEVRPEPEKKTAETKAPAAAESAEEGEGSQIELLTFSLGSEEFALRVTEVEEILRYQKMTHVPTMPDYVIGITSLRGKIIPVIDLKKRLGLSSAEGEKDDPAEPVPGARDAKVLIIAGARGVIGATIDRVIGVVRLAGDKVLEPPAHLTEAEIKYIEGIVILDKRFISVLRSEDTVNIEIG